jgi:hypothetical protein
MQHLQQQQQHLQQMIAQNQQRQNSLRQYMTQPASSCRTMQQQQPFARFEEDSRWTAGIAVPASATFLTAHCLLAAATALVGEQCPSWHSNCKVAAI